MDDHKGKKEICRAGIEISRRDFLKASGIIVIGVGLGGCTINDDVTASEGYLLVDTKKCQGCLTCMLSCSLVHEGIESLSLARIQVVQNPFTAFPDDINIAQCRQCVDPACLAACRVGWFTRSGFGGRFGPMLKYAGWDGIVMEGKAEGPVWLDIRDGEVQIKNATSLWGLDTWKTQQTIWEEVSGGGEYGGWVDVGPAENGARSTQRPAVLAIGPAGEILCRVASLIHDAGNGAGQGGFGAVWGSKNLKTIL